VIAAGLNEKRKLNGLLASAYVASPGNEAKIPNESSLLFRSAPKQYDEAKRTSKRTVIFSMRGSRNGKQERQLQLGGI